MAHLGFVGLGIMGQPMVGHLLAAGHTVYVYDRVPESVAAVVAKGAVTCGSAREVASRVDTIFTMVPDTPDVAEVIFGEGGIAEGVGPGSVVVDMSTISPLATRDFARRLKCQGVDMLDAPVSGGQVGAEAGTLSIMVGGPAGVFERVKSYFEPMGKNIIHIGPEHGDGQTCKAANQICLALTLLGVSEALLFAAKAGADPAKVRQAILGGFARSNIMDLCGGRMIERRFAPGFRIRHQQKDLNLALQSARSLGLSLPGTALAQELFSAVAGQGGSELDHSALVLALERLAGQEVGKKAD